ncbi:MAG: heme biosynthesis protein HemY [Alphaproteobacteria bacterium]|nr:heme biosynthesis protein HemY [Alphaproteobacteria bacterium]
MRRTLLYLIQLALIVAVAIWLAEQPGEVRIDWMGWRVETSAAILALLVLALVWVLAVLRGMWLWLRRAPGQFVEARRERRREEGYEALGRGLAAVAAGDASEARRLARKASNLLDEPPLTRLLSAQAAQLGGDEVEAERQFEAMRADPATEFIGLRGLLAKALRDGDRERALALAERALELKPGLPWLLKQTFSLQAEAGKWRAAMGTLADAAGRGAVTKEVARRARTAMLTARAEETDDPGEAKHLLIEAVDLSPCFAPAAVGLAHRHATAGAQRKAIKALERAWSAAPHPDLMRAWIALKVDASALDRLRWLQRLTQTHADNRESRLALAEASLDAQLWGEARRLLQDLASQPTPRVVRLMARVEREERNDIEAARAWLERQPSAEPDPLWVCSACGAQSTGWAARCGNCSAFDSLDWKPPPRIQRIERPPPMLSQAASEPVPEIPPTPAASG